VAIVAEHRPYVSIAFSGKNRKEKWRLGLEFGKKFGEGGYGRLVGEAWYSVTGHWSLVIC